MTVPHSTAPSSNGNDLRENGAVGEICRRSAFTQLDLFASLPGADEKKSAAAAFEADIVPRGVPVAPCRTDPEAWHTPSLASEAKKACAECPFKRRCARAAADFAHAGEYRVSGVWAGVEFLVDDTKSVYARKVREVKAVARTGYQPVKRRRGRKPGGRSVA